MLPEVTVVIPTRDRPGLLEQTLTSVRRQRGVALEVLVVDDGSTRPARDLVAPMRDPRVRVLRNERCAGVAAARNRGIDAAGGRWVAFCDDDDLWAPDKLRRQLDAVHASRAGWAYAGAVAFLPTGQLCFHSRPPAGDVLGRLSRRNVVPGGCSNVLADRALVQSVGAFDERLRTLADWDLWLRLARRAAPAVIDAPLVGYRLHTGNMSGDPAGVLAEFRIIEAATTDLRDGAGIDAAWLHRWLGQAALRAGALPTAVACYGRAVRWGQPESFLRPIVALLGHRTARRVEARRRPVDARWCAEAGPWLEQLLGSAAQGAPARAATS